MTTARGTKPRRADAEHNRAKILEAARAAFTDPGAGVSMAEVSRRAGVGMATLYRNFPGRRELLEALYVDEVDAICAAAHPPVTGTPGEAVHRCLSACVVPRADPDLVAEGTQAGGDLVADPLVRAGDERGLLISHAFTPVGRLWRAVPPVRSGLQPDRLST